MRPILLSRRSLGIETLPVSRFAGKEIRDSSRIYARNPSLRKRWDGCAAIAFIPFDPGASVENPRRGFIQCRCEISIAEIPPKDFNVLIRSVRHRIGEKAPREFECFFSSSKPEDALCNSQKFVRVSHRSLPREAKSRFPTSTGSSSNFTPAAAVRNAFCTGAGSSRRSRYRLTMEIVSIWHDSWRAHTCERNCGSHQTQIARCPCLAGTRRK